MRETAEPLGLLAQRRRHRTELRARGPSLQPHAPLGLSLDHRAARVSYESQGRSLAGLYIAPTLGRARAPALLYLHGGWALSDADMRDCWPFVEAGFAVFTPSYRGENGNPGDHEMLWGEHDDALAALAWLRARPEVDGDHVFVFGHSAGGMLAILLAFEPELDACLTGSVDGIYGPDVFDVQHLPFVDTPRERELRLALPHIEALEQPHIAFVGRDDPALEPSFEARRRAHAAGCPFELVVVPGDHRQSVAPAITEFLGCARHVL